MIELIFRAAAITATVVVTLLALGAVFLTIGRILVEIDEANKKKANERAYAEQRAACMAMAERSAHWEKNRCPERFYATNLGGTDLGQCRKLKGHDGPHGDIRYD